MATINIRPGDNIQSAINAAAAGDTISFAAGTYNIGQTINLKSNVTYHGDAGATLNMNFNGSMLNVSNLSNVTIEGLTFQGGSTRGSGFGGIIMGENTTNLTIRDNTFQHIGLDAAVYIYESDDLKVVGNNFVDVHQGVSYINNEPIDHGPVTIASNTFKGVERMAIEVQQDEQGAKVGIPDAAGINGLYVDYNSIDNSQYPNGALLQPMISLVGGTYDGEKTSVQHNTITNAYWAIETDNRDMTVEHNTMSKVTWGIGISHTPNSSYQNNIFTNVDHPFSENGGYIGDQWVGVNTVNGQSVTGWAGHANSSATPPAAAGRDTPSTPPDSAPSAPAAPAEPATPTTGADTLVLHVAGDSYQGNPEFIVSVDGKQVGGTLTATASHGAGEWQEVTLKGDFGSGAHSVVVTFLNDLYGGTATTDRNLYVNGMEFNGTHYAGATTLYTTGNTATFATAAAPAPTAPAAPTSASTTITVNASGSPAGGTNAHFNLLVDGKKIGEGVAGTSAKDFSFTTSVLPDAAHKIQVQYDNDGVVNGQDRNLYVNKITINGHAVNPTDNIVTYDKGALDGKDVAKGQAGMWWNGTLVVNADKGWFPASATTLSLDDVSQADIYNHVVTQGLSAAPVATEGAAYGHDLSLTSPMDVHTMADSLSLLHHHHDAA